MVDLSVYRWHPRPWSYRLAKATLGPILRLYFRVAWQGAEHMPRSGPLILASNHQSNLDPLMLGLSSPRPVNMMGKIELFRNPVLRAIITSWGTIPLRRGASDPEALRLADEVLQTGHVLGLFPEGTRSKDGNLQRFRFGAVRLALKHNATLMPMALSGTANALPRGARFPRRTRVRVAYGAPIDLAPYRAAVEAGEATRHDLVAQATEALHAAVEQLLAQTHEMA